MDSATDWYPAMELITDILVVIWMFVAGGYGALRLYIRHGVAKRRRGLRKDEPIDLNIQPTPEMNWAYDASDWGAFEDAAGRYLNAA